MAEPMDTTGDIDEGLYSRQLYVLGHEAMRRMKDSNVLVSGMRGVGVEIAKNVILGGVKSISIHDPESITHVDLSSQYYFSVEDIGKNRANVAVPKLAELNSYVSVNEFEKDLSPANLEDYNVIVLTESNTTQAIEIDEYCRANGKFCIVARCCGLFGQIFCDFGEKFTVYDENDTQPSSFLIASITQETESVVTTLDEARHGLEDGHYVKFSEVKGMTELNTDQPFKIKVLGPYTFSIGDTSKFGAYVGGGIATQIKMPKEFAFKSLKESLATPEIVMTDYANFTRGHQLHLAFQALDEFEKSEGSRPRPGSQEDAQKLLELVKQLNPSLGDAQVEDLDEKMLFQFASQSTGSVQPMDGLIGSIAAQEVMKACSGKFTPVVQFAYFDSLKCLPEKNLPEASDLQPVGSRYDGMIAIFGKAFVERMKRLKYFIVGAGAIGCELLKVFAMLGVACSPDGKLFITDMDTIEKSNLNRQFLFRPQDVTHLKSQVAARAAKSMNPDINIEAHSTRVGPDTEDIYDDSFFNQLDGVANALDNVEARQYMDRRCVFYKKPLLESGTLGTQGSTQVVLPDLTASYSSTQDPPEKSIPICTLKNFPYKIEHTIQWARDLFEGLFNQTPDSVNQYLSSANFVEQLKKQAGSQPVDILKGIEDCLVNSRPLSFDDCIVWARFKFDELYNHSIKQMLFNFPADKLAENGQPFWSGTKRLPQPQEFDPSNELHANFVTAAAILRAQMFNLKGTSDAQSIAQAAAKVQVPAFKPKSNVHIETDEKAAQSSTPQFAEDEVGDLLQRLPDRANYAGFKLMVHEFEKDDDSNHHMDFITAASNLRATNYSIEPADKHQTKGIAGKIIPAIATTTAMVASLVGLELCKLVNGNKDIDSYVSASVNLAIPCFNFFAPQACSKSKYNDVEFTLWDRFEIQGDITLQQLLDIFQEQHKLEITMLSCGVSMLYSFFMDAKKRKARLGSKVSKVVEEVTKETIGPHVKHLILEPCCDDAEGEEADVPYIVYKLE